MGRLVSRVGPVVQIPAVELRRAPTVNRQIERRQLVEDRCIISDAEERNGRLRRSGVDYWGLCCLWSHSSLSLRIISTTVCHAPANFWTGRMSQKNAAGVCHTDWNIRVSRGVDSFQLMPMGLRKYSIGQRDPEAIDISGKC